MSDEVREAAHLLVREGERVLREHGEDRVSGLWQPILTVARFALSATARPAAPSAPDARDAGAGDEVELLRAEIAKLKQAIILSEDKLYQCSVGHGVADHRGYPCVLPGEARLIMIEALGGFRAHNEARAALASVPAGQEPDARDGDYDWRADWQSVLMFIGYHREKLPEYPEALHAAIGRLIAHSGGVAPSIWTDQPPDARDAVIEQLRAALEDALPTLKRPSHDHPTCDCGPCKVMRRARTALASALAPRREHAPGS